MSLERELAVDTLNDLEAHNPDALRLARVASVAIRLEPHLIRRLRLELVPNADVGAEGDLWFSALVESSGSSAIVLQPEAARILREHLAQERALLVRALTILREAHHAAPSTLQLEEEINGLALLRDPDCADRIDRALRPALITLVRDDADRALEIARWVLRAAPSFDPAVWQSGNAHALVHAASALLRERRFVKPPSTGRPALSTLAWALPPSVLANLINVGVQLFDRAVRFVDPADAATIEVPATNPPLVELSYTLDGSERLQLAEAVPGTEIALAGVVDSLVLRTSAGDEFHLEATVEEAPADRPPVTDATWRPNTVKVLEPSWMDDACVPVETLGSQGEPATAFYISPTRLVTAAVRFRGIPFLATPHGQVAVVNARDESSAVLLLDRVEGSDQAPVRPLRLGTNPTRRAGTNQLIVPSVARVIAVVEGKPIAIEVDVRGSLMQSGQARFEAHADERRLPPSFLGAPILIGEEVAGVVTELDPGVIGRRTRLVATGSVVVLDLERRQGGPAPLPNVEQAAPASLNVDSAAMNQAMNAAPSEISQTVTPTVVPVRAGASKLVVSEAVDAKPAESDGVLKRLNRRLTRLIFGEPDKKSSSPE